MFETLGYVSKNGIGLITLSRPDRLNAINPAMAAELSTLCSAVRADDSLRAVIITGAPTFRSTQIASRETEITSTAFIIPPDKFGARNG